MGIIEDGLDALGGLFTDSKGNTDYGNLISLGGAILGGTGVTGSNTPVTGPAPMILTDGREVVDNATLHSHNMYLKVKPLLPLCLLKVWLR